MDSSCVPLSKSDEKLRAEKILQHLHYKAKECLFTTYKKHVVYTYFIFFQIGFDILVVNLPGGRHWWHSFPLGPPALHGVLSVGLQSNVAGHRGGGQSIPLHIGGYKQQYFILDIRLLLMWSGSILVSILHWTISESRECLNGRDRDWCSHIPTWLRIIHTW